MIYNNEWACEIFYKCIFICTKLVASTNICSATFQAELHYKVSGRTAFYGWSNVNDCCTMTKNLRPPPKCFNLHISNIIHEVGWKIILYSPSLKRILWKIADQEIKLFTLKGAYLMKNNSYFQRVQWPNHHELTFKM